MGRPSDFSQEIADTVCLRLADGQTLREICRDEAMPARSTIHLWLLQHEAFSDQYARARDIQVDGWADEIMEISDDGSNDWQEREHGPSLNGEHVQRSKLRVDTRKWLMGKAAPKKYGDKVAHEVAGKDGGAITTSLTVTFLKPGQTPDEG